jgi:hypothetical protein
MLELVSTAEALDQIRGDSVADASWLATWIPAVSEAVANWLKESWRLYVPELDSSGSPVLDSSGHPIPSEDSSGLIVRPVVKAAVLIELASQYRFREGEGDNDMLANNRANAGLGYGYMLNRASTSLLASLRKSTIA